MSSLPPRPKTGQTPTNNGKFRAPAAPVSGPRPRRGITPRSGRTKTPGGGVVTSQTNRKPKLTAEQQLEIIRRLDTGNFKKDGGLSQFYEEFSKKDQNPPRKLPCAQNLYSTFAIGNVDPLASSTRIYGSGRAGSMESLLSMSSVSTTHSNTTTVIGNGESEATMIEARGKNEPMFHGEENSSYYLETFDKLFKEMNTYFKNLEELALLRCKTKFAEFLPQDKMTTFFQTLDRVYKIMKRFLDGNASDNMGLFMPAPTTKGPRVPAIRCDVQDHSKAVETFCRLNEVLWKLESFFEHDRKNLQVEKKLQAMKEMVNTVEELIKSKEKLVLEAKEMTKKTKVLSENHDECRLSECGSDDLGNSPSLSP